MLKNEFFDRTGLQVSDNEYARIDSMYNYCGDMAIKLVGFKKYAKEVLRMGYSLRGKYLDQMIDLLDN